MRRRHVVQVAAAILLPLGFGPCVPAGEVGPEAVCADPADCRLWEAGRIAGVRVGFHDESGGNATGDVAVAAREGNVTTNHGVSWRGLQPTPTTVGDSMDRACAFAADHDQFQVGYHYAWHQVLLDDLADWVLAITDADELRAVLRERVHVIFERCPGIDRIDVINEPLVPWSGSTVYTNHFYEVLGPDYIAELFRIVRAEAPEHVELFLNENLVEYFPERAAAFVDIVRTLVASDAPVDAVGLQTHLILLGDPDWDLFRATLEDIAALGVKVFITELDVPVSLDTPGRADVQAARYQRVVEVCLAVPACDTLIVWGISDAHTWLDWFTLFTGPDSAPLLFDDDLEPKPAYFAVRDALLRGRGGDHPVAGAKLALTRSWWGDGVLTFSSEGPGVVTPSPGSRNDPSRADSTGAVIELRQPDGSVATYEVAPGRGWSVTQGTTSFWGALGDGGTMLWLRMQEGGGWHLSLRGGELSPADASAGLELRITLGSLRLCADFGADTVVRNGVRRVVARGAPRASGYRCDFAAE